MTAARHVGFTGTRLGMTVGQAAEVAVLLRDWDWLHHGLCVGADDEAHMIARKTGLKVHGHPPDRDTLRLLLDCDAMEEPLPYLARNRSIVHATALLIAAPGTAEPKARSGTWSTVRYAWRIGRPVRIVRPDGSLVSQD